MRMDPRGFYVYWVNQSKVINGRRDWTEGRKCPCAQKYESNRSKVGEVLEEKGKALIAAYQHKLADEMMFQIAAFFRVCVCVYV